jgi:hypothetical protein
VFSLDELQEQQIEDMSCSCQVEDWGIPDDQSCPPYARKTENAFWVIEEAIYT